MKHKCDRCHRPATVRFTEAKGGQKIQRFLCDLHAAEEGLVAAAPDGTPINQILQNFVKIHSGVINVSQEQPTCPSCGMSFREFREKSLLGCPDCYAAFESLLGPLLERAHAGAVHHVGKSPTHAGESIDRQGALMRMRQRLQHAVEHEDYELAARLRDEISDMEAHRS